MLIETKSFTFIFVIITCFFVGFFLGVEVDYLERSDIFCEIDREFLKEIETNVFQAIIKCELK